MSRFDSVSDLEYIKELAETDYVDVPGALTPGVSDLSLFVTEDGTAASLMLGLTNTGERVVYPLDLRLSEDHAIASAQSLLPMGFEHTDEALAGLLTQFGAVAAEHNPLLVRYGTAGQHRAQLSISGTPYDAEDTAYRLNTTVELGLNPEQDLHRLAVLGLATTQLHEMLLLGAVATGE